MPFRPDEITRDHVLRAVQRIDREQIRLNPSRKFDVLIDGRPYPPKGVMKYAHAELPDGEPRWDLSGGAATNSRLEAMGFQVRSKELVSDPVLKLVQRYKESIRESGLAGELYKWRIVKKLKGHPDPEAEDFAGEMRSLEYGNLVYHIAPTVIRGLAEDRTEPYRKAMARLLDETIPTQDRVTTFIAEVDAIHSELSERGSHHDERTISALLTSASPDKYTFYKASYYTKFCRLLGVDVAPTGKRLVHYLELLRDFVDDYVLPDNELLTLVDSFLTDDCYEDPNRLLLGQDILYQSLDLTKSEETVWLYAPGTNGELWDEFYEQGIMGIGWDRLGDLRSFGSRDEMANRLVQEYGGTSDRTNDSLANFEFANKINIGDLVIVKSGRSKYLGYGYVTSDYEFDEFRESYKSIRRVDWQEKGEWDANFKLVVKTLTNISKYPDYVRELKDLLGITAAATVPGRTDRIMNQYPLNSIFYGPPGTGKTYTTISGAVKIATGKTFGSHSEYKAEFDRLRRDGQIEFITFHQSYSYEDFVAGIRPDVDTGNLSFLSKKGVFYEIAKRARDNFEAARAGAGTSRSFEEVFTELIEPLERGETVPVTMASGQEYKITDVSQYSISFEKPSGTSLHTLSISTLEEFVAGRREAPHGLAPYYKPLAKLLTEMRSQPGPTEELKNFVLIIDEINRGNISRIFGELITLIEDDKRLGGENELRVTLPNGEKDFAVPPNLYLLGTMNTADKSIALIDIALRRRFEFVGFYPKAELVDDEASAALLEHINRGIYERKKSADFLVGHAYFMKNEPLETVLRNRVLPLLMEYFSSNISIVTDIFQGSGWRVEYDSFDWVISGD